jgi:formate-dependent nitrite reductase cytochrome c552 subunit
MKDYERDMIKDLKAAGVDTSKIKSQLKLKELVETRAKQMNARFKSLEDLLEKTMKEIDMWADDQEVLREMNPLYAHIKIAQILNDIIPALRDLYIHKLEVN